jgi:hypothetical protein
MGDKDFVTKKFKKAMHKFWPLIHICDEIFIPPNVNRQTEGSGKKSTIKFACHFKIMFINLVDPGQPTGFIWIRGGDMIQIRGSFDQGLGAVGIGNAPRVINNFLAQRFGFNIINVPEIDWRIDPIIFGDKELNPAESVGISEKTLRWDTGQLSGVIIALSSDLNVVVFDGW